MIVAYLGMLLLTTNYSSGNEHIIVETNVGRIRGFKLLSRAGKEFFQFRGIPFAQPPLGELRFQPPKPIEPWSEVLDALEFGQPCIQVSIFDPSQSVRGQEDCLTLSISTPNVSANFPVLVHFHGGAYSSGDSSIYGPHYLMDENLIVVTVNFRIGIFGFLSFETKEMPGNQGMKDQVMALQWVQKNIGHFGGDPQLVTIIGESSGAASVYNHLVSPLSKGLFHRGIVQSGSTYAPWGLAPPGFAKKTAFKLMFLLNCSQTYREAIKCILKKDAEDIASQFPKFLVWQIDPVLSFVPVLEPPGPGAFLIGPISKWEHVPVPLIMSTTSAEGLLRTTILLNYQTDFKWFSTNFNDIAPTSFLYFASVNPEAITEKIRNYYFPNHEISMADWFNLTMLYSDAWFSMPVLEGANHHKGPVFVYYFDYLLKGTFLFSIPEELQIGAFHCSDMGLLWNLSIPMVPNVSNEEELKLSKYFIKILTSFIKDGVPTIEGSENKWAEWNPAYHNYLHITRNGLHIVKEGLLTDRYTFWKTLNYLDANK